MSGDDILRAFREQFSLPLDPEITYAVWVLRAAGIETYESCSGTEGHSFTEPTIRFNGGYEEGLRAVSVAMKHRLPVFSLRRFWTVQDGELTGPDWELTFYPLGRLIEIQEQVGSQEFERWLGDPALRVEGRAREATCARR